MIEQKISERFLSSIGLFQNMFGSRYSDLVAIRQDKERVKRILYEVYGFKDIYEVVPKELDDESVDRVLRTIFTYHEQDPERLKQILEEKG